MSEEHEYSMVMPFWIDTDAYTQRDREMFVCGVEFMAICKEIEEGFRGKRAIPIHTENESRFRMMCGKLGLICECLPTGVEGWSDLTILDNN